jgi:peroxiredoxin
MRADLQPGNRFPDFSLPDTDGSLVPLEQRMDGWPTIVTFNRGNYVPRTAASSSTMRRTSSLNCR